ncbi:pyridoxal phosphate-dependent transferase [Calycina marina]|uniref:Pyridoxal phosphate-dependent transferase n=1 Tax=Calycina marina TaxID=1763456 RepID=A0A9P7YV73_9HELO|nr:pyridoxal phosphate-dependent transferase [Calycina marina]
MAVFDIEQARGKFPSLKQQPIYFDNAGGSQALGTVIESINGYLSNNNVQMGSTYGVGLKAAAHYQAGYKAAADYINATPEQIVLGSSTTQMFRNLSFAMQLLEGSELIISKIDHEANIAPWVHLAGRQNLTIKWWVPKTTENPTLEASDLKELLTPNTKLVCCTHASNILGTIHDIKAIADAVHTIPQALLCVDAVAYAPHRPVDVQELGVDFYAFSWYKVYGPHIAMLYASKKGLSTIQSLGHYFNPTTTLENKLGLSGSSYELVAAIPSVVSYFGTDRAVAWAAIEAREAELQSTLLTYLNGRSDVTIYGNREIDTKKRVSTISFLVKGWKSQDLVEKVDEVSKGEIGIRWGGFYSARLVEEVFTLGKDGVVRASFVHYNTVDEVKRLIAIFDEILGQA